MTTFLITKVGFNNGVRYVATLVGVTSILAFVMGKAKPQTYQALTRVMEKSTRILRYGGCQRPGFPLVYHWDVLPFFRLLRCHF